MTALYIVLATYQGARYLPEQVESIRRQSRTDWRLLVRDDGSTDATPRLLRQLAAEDDRITLIDDGGQRYGAAGNFAVLMERARRDGAEYLFFADQDDVWRPDKLRRQLEAIQQAEGNAAERVPCLAYSDLTVVDDRSQTIHPSFLRHSRLVHGGRAPLGTLLGRSFVLGCACAVNRPLLEFALPLPETAAMHDWWLAISAAATGRVVGLAEPLVRYRRHGGNSSGPAGFWSGFTPWRHSWRRRWQAGAANFARSIQQARTLRERLGQRKMPVAPATLQQLDDYCRIFESPVSRLSRIFALCRQGMPQIDVPRRLLFYLCVALGVGGKGPS
jgi:glycosyltransferase involved in cell wall biosynthesis